MAETIKKTINDIPTEDDHFGMESRNNGLVRFIRSCSTPMTIAVQGDWGMGKTSVMKNVMHKLSADDSETIPCIWFDTWQFTALPEGSSVFVEFLITFNQLLMKMVSAEINKNKLTNDETKEKKLKTISKILDKVGTLIGSGGEVLGDFISESNPLRGALIKSGTSLVEKWLSDPSELLESIEKIKVKRSSIGSYDDYTLSKTHHLNVICNLINISVRAIAESQSKYDRICIFIDDLDRLQPRVAIELLEGIKNFVDFEKCVFVLAIDKEMVIKGLESKYGSDIYQSYNGERSRADKFFDKLIQVPFNIPRKEKTDIEEYVRHLLDIQEYVDSEDENLVRNYVDVLSELRIFNPRSIKRLYNLTELHECIVMSDYDTDDSQNDFTVSKWKRLAIFIVLILQIEYEEIYKGMYYYIIRAGSVKRAMENYKKYISEKSDPNICNYAVLAVEKLEEINNKVVTDENNISQNLWLKKIFTASSSYFDYNEQRYITQIRKLMDKLKECCVDNDFSSYSNVFKESDYALAENFSLKTKNENNRNIINVETKLGNIGISENVVAQRPYIGFSFSNDFTAEGCKVIREFLKQNNMFIEDIPNANISDTDIENNNLYRFNIKDNAIIGIIIKPGASQKAGEMLIELFKKIGFEIR